MDIPKYLVMNPLFIRYRKPLKKNRIQVLYEMKMQKMKDNILFLRYIRKQVDRKPRIDL